MSIAKAIEVGEKAIQDMKAKKDADRLAKLSAEEKKAEEAKTAAAKQAEADRVILESKDDALDEAGKKRKAEIVEARKKAEAAEEKRILEAKEDELSEEEKPKKADLLRKKEKEREAEKEAKIQARIDEVVGELKAEKADRAKDKEKIASLEAELKKLQGKDSKTVIIEAKKLEQARASKYAEEDKNLPREERREMPKDELEEWFAEDIVAAQTWLADQAVRRDKERTADINRLSKTGESDDSAAMKAKAEAVIKKQNESKARVIQKHPELDITKRLSGLKAEGKNEKEIQEIIFKENPKVRVIAEIMKEGEDKYLLSENAPELLVEEMERRLAGKSKGETQEERDERLRREGAEAERQRLAGIDEGLNSTRAKGAETKMGDFEKEQWEIFQKQFPQKTLVDFRKMQERRRKYANA